MKIDRLMGIVVYLLNHGRTSARKLAEKFEVAPRTIMRDLEALDQAGIPIQSFCGAEGGYQIMDSFVLEKQAVTKHEYDWIIAALKGMATAYTSKGLEQILAKVKSVDHREEIAVSLDLSAAAEDERISRYLRLLEDSIERKCAVRFSYTNRHNEAKALQVEPVSLQYKWYNWYLIGYCGKYQDYCMFKLVRIDHLQATDIQNTKTHILSDIALKDGDDRIVHVKLYGKAVIKSRCREYLNGRITREFENGDFEFCFSAPECEMFWYGVILSFGGNARILEPPEVKERVIRTCREIQMEYEE